jgi:hypothetical protein
MKNKLSLAVVALALFCIGAGQTPLDNYKLTNVFNHSPKEAWISATRTDGKGMGTQIDPFDGSTATKFNSIISSLPAGSTVHLASDVGFSGLIDLSPVARITFDGEWHKITSASQTDTRKIAAGNPAGAHIKNLEIDGTWDHTTSGSSTGDAIDTYYPHTTVENIYIHDLMDVGIAHNGDFSDCRFLHITIRNTKYTGIFANSQNAVSPGPSEFGDITVVNTGVDAKGLGIAMGGAGTNRVYGVNAHDIFVDGVGVFGGGSSSQEALYIHGLTDFHLSHIRASNNIFGVSCDYDDHGTIDDIITRGGNPNQFCGLELAGCFLMTVSNSEMEGDSRTNAPVTMSIASPGVITWTAHGFANGQPIRFDTTGALPTGFRVGSVYFIVNVATNTFQLATTVGGTPINTTGSQSGTHTATATTGNGASGISVSNVPTDFNVRNKLVNVTSRHWAAGLSVQGGYHFFDVIGGGYSGFGSGMSFDGVDNIKLIGATIEVTSGNGVDVSPLGFIIETNSKDISVLDCTFNNLAEGPGCEINIGRVGGATLDRFKVIGNTKLDTSTLSFAAIKYGGGFPKENRVIGNFPAEIWPNEPLGKKLVFTPGATGWYRILQGPTLTGRATITTNVEDWEVRYQVPQYGEQDYVTESFGSVGHGSTATLTQVRVGSTNEQVYLDLYVGTSGTETRIYIHDDGFTFDQPTQGITLINPPAFSPAAPTSNLDTIKLSNYVTSGTQKVVSGFSAYLTTSTNAGNAAWAKVPFNVERYDRANDYDETTNHKFVAPQSGVYQFSWGLSAGASSTRFISALYINNTEHARGVDQDASFTLTTSTGSAGVYMNAGDYAEIFSFSDAGVALAVGTSSLNYFTGTLIGR